MGHIVDKCGSENVKHAFKTLKEKLQRNQDALSIKNGNSYGSPSGLNSNAGMIRVPDQIRRMLTIKFENLGWSDAEYFLQTLGKIFSTVFLLCHIKCEYKNNYTYLISLQI